MNQRLGWERAGKLGRGGGGRQIGRKDNKIVTFLSLNSVDWMVAGRPLLVLWLRALTTLGSGCVQPHYPVFNLFYICILYIIL
jgi:hypothetical protein